MTQNEDNRHLLKRLSVRVDALRRAMDTVIAGTTPDYAKWGAFKNYARVYNPLAREYIELSGDNAINMYDIERMKGSMELVWPVQKQLFDTIYADVLILSSMLSEYDTGMSASISEIQDLLTANLRKSVFDKPEGERAIQNAVEALFIGRGYQRSIDYDRETGRVKYSGNEFIPDFIFARYSLVIEVKLVKRTNQVSRCVEEMSADVSAYLSMYRNVLFCIYDLGFIRDVMELESGLQSHDGVRIVVIKH